MNVLWAQLWTLLCIPAKMKGYSVNVLIAESSRPLMRYFGLLGIRALSLEAALAAVPEDLPAEIVRGFDNAQTFDAMRALSVECVPLGEIALSTYCRYHGKARVNIQDPETRRELRIWLVYIWRSYRAAHAMFGEHHISAAYFTETFMEEYGGFYYAALNLGLNILRFAGTVRDDGLIVQHRDWGSERLHHAALHPSTWAAVKSLPDLPRIKAELTRNFADRYGEKWHRSKRNQPGAKIVDPVLARAELGMSKERKIAVVYSHILYDTIFFFGTDLFQDYATWLVETVRAACSNDRLEWFIKVHPANVWRGETQQLLGGRYQEEILISQTLGTLPPHVHIVPADSKISPLTWMRLADFGITVRGTSGLEMAALGKTVITAGTGRYEGNGFTLDPKTAADYLALLGRLPDVAEPTPLEVEWAERYAHAIFLLKPFEVKSVEPRLAAGRSKVVASDDLLYVPRSLVGSELPEDLARFGDFVDDRSRIDFLSDFS